MNLIEQMVLVGIGKIGYKGFAENHFQCAKNSMLDVVAAIDTSNSARDSFTGETGIESFNSLSEMPMRFWNSFFTVATDAESSFQVVCELLENGKPLGILLEKPFCADSAQSRRILELQNISRIPLRINYSRQYSIGMKSLKTLTKGQELISGVVIYSSGLRQNGSHFLRIICGLFPAIDLSKSVTWDSPTQFRLNITQDAIINFVPLESGNLHMSEIRLVYKDILVNISEGLTFQISHIDSNTQNRLWPRELKVIQHGDLSGGFANSYVDRTWWQKPDQLNLSMELSLDHQVNEIIDSYTESSPKFWNQAPSSDV